MVISSCWIVWISSLETLSSTWLQCGLKLEVPILGFAGFPLPEDLLGNPPPADLAVIFSVISQLLDDS
jgi:hypothetical protein